MATHFSHASLPYPIRGARYSLLVPYLGATGDPTLPTTPDTEISKDNGTAVDCTEEAVATTSMDGMALMTVTGSETDATTVALNAKAASGPKPTLATLYPRSLIVFSSGTMSAGSAGGGTLGAIVPEDIRGCFVKTTGGTGGGGSGGADNQARKIITYNTSSGAFTVVPNWETTPSTSTTYEVLLPENITPHMIQALRPNTAGEKMPTLVSGRADASVGAMAANVLTATAINTGAFTSAKFADAFLTAAKIEANAIGATQIANSALHSGAFSGGTLDLLRDNNWSKIVDATEAWTAQEVLSILLSVLAGRTTVSGLTYTMLTPDNSATRVVFTLDANKQRVGVVATPSA